MSRRSKRESHMLLFRAVKHEISIFSLFCILFLCIGSLAIAQKGPKARVPQQVIQELSKDKFINDCVKESRGAQTIFEAELLNVNPKGPPSLLVSGRKCLCGASQCPAWLYRRTAKGYTLILDAGYIMDVRLWKHFTNGYRDLTTIAHDSAFDSYLYVYRFDRQKYQVRACYKRQFRNKQGGFEGKIYPTTKRIKCED
jgi:hypothetical protein